MKKLAQEKEKAIKNLTLISNICIFVEVILLILIILLRVKGISINSWLWDVFFFLAFFEIVVCILKAGIYHIKNK